MKVCSRCKQDKPLAEFNVNTKRSGHQVWCKLCQKETKAAWHQENKDKTRATAKLRRDANLAKIVAYLSEHSCVDCGNSDIRVLEFDHRDRSQKLNNISMMTEHSWAKILEEISKCDVRCANCHRIRTREQLGWLTR